MMEYKMTDYKSEFRNLDLRDVESQFFLLKR